MNTFFTSTVLTATGAAAITNTTVIQTLWKGYGEIVRVELEGSDHASIVAKHISIPTAKGKQRAATTDLSHARKLKSYRVETAWYESWSNRCNQRCRVPHCLTVKKQGDEVIIVLEDLDNAGFARRCPSPSWSDITAGLKWLAEFHATFLQQSPEGLWNVGTYWHLDTRPDELKMLNDSALKRAAGRIDRLLKQSIQTVVHGDAKIENFCFSNEGDRVAAVDFQYVGSGCGMKDVAYFVASCLHDEQCGRHENDLLDHYFDALKNAMVRQKSRLDPTTVETEWRPLYRVAWADFHRFYKGWGQHQFDHNCYSELLTKEVIAKLLYPPLLSPLHNR